MADRQITGEQVVDTNGSGHGALSGFLNGMGVDTLICGGIGYGAKVALSEAGIELYGGATGVADDVVRAFLAGDLDYNPDTQCSHHEHGHQEGHCHGHCGENVTIHGALHFAARHPASKIAVAGIQPLAVRRFFNGLDALQFAASQAVNSNGEQAWLYR